MLDRSAPLSSHCGRAALARSSLGFHGVRLRCWHCIWHDCMSPIKMEMETLTCCTLSLAFPFPARYLPVLGGQGAVPFMVMGADVTHPTGAAARADARDPSVAAVVATLDASLGRWGRGMCIKGCVLRGGVLAGALWQGPFRGAMAAAVGARTPSLLPHHKSPLPPAPPGGPPACCCRLGGRRSSPAWAQPPRSCSWSSTGLTSEGAGRGDGGEGGIRR